MGLLVVDESKCNRDAICADVCPSRIIILRGKEGFPQILPRLEAGCIRCGHCVAVCPTGALSHREMPVEDCPPVDPALAVDQGRAEQFLRSRRSIRVFRDKPVPGDLLRRLIEVARYAPTAGNSQRVVWRVATDPAAMVRTADLAAAYLKKVIDTRPKGSYPVYYASMVAGHKAGRDPILRRAPVLVVASAPQMLSNGSVDVSLALSYLELMAPSLGLGTCWAGIVYSALANDPEVKRILGVPEDHPFFYSMLVGYPKYEYRRLPQRRSPEIEWR